MQVNFLNKKKQTTVFRIPFSVVFESQYGTQLVADAVAGKQIMHTRIANNPECNYFNHPL
jgi:hypothetical protein